MTETRIITKQSNRRLYDTGASKHVTLDDVRVMVAGGERIRVLDAKTKEDVTRSVLVQIVAEQELLGAPVLSEAFLETLIRLYSNPVQGLVSSYLEASLKQFGYQQDDLMKRWQQMFTGPGPAAWGDTAQEGMDALTRMQKAFLDTWLQAEDGKPGHEDES